MSVCIFGKLKQAHSNLLEQIKQLEQAQDSSYNYNLFFLSFVNLATLEQLGQNNTQLLHFMFNVGPNAVGPNTELMHVLAIMLIVYPLLSYFVQD